MERRDRSLEALSTLQYIDSLNSNLRADSIVRWVNKYLTNTNIEDFSLDINQSKELLELFNKNIFFLRQHREEMKYQIDNHKKIREFLK